MKTNIHTPFEEWQAKFRVVKNGEAAAAQFIQTVMERGLDFSYYHAGRIITVFCKTDFNYTEVNEDAASMFEEFLELEYDMDGNQNF